MGRIIFEQQSFQFEQIRQGLPLEMVSPFSSAMLFCQEWLNGKNSFLLYTSGSTGAPKPIALGRTQMEASARATGEALGLSKGDTALVCLNTSYIAGIMMLVRGMVLDLDLIVVAPTASPLSLIPEDCQPDFVALVPLQLQTILEEQDSKSLQRLNHMKAILVGGAPLTQALEERTQALTAPVYSSYGMTETVSHIALRRVNGESKEQEYTVLPQVSIDIDARGCLKVLSPVTQNQWIQTNDLVEITSARSFRWTGRADHVINSGGIKLQPETIESVLAQPLLDNGIHHYFIAGLPHPQLGEAVTLFVETEKGMELLLHEKIRPVLDRFSLPKGIIAVPSFAKTNSGKTDRHAIVKDFSRYYFS